MLNGSRKKESESQRGLLFSINKHDYSYQCFMCITKDEKFHLEREVEDETMYEATFVAIHSR